MTELEEKLSVIVDCLPDSLFKEKVRETHAEAMATIDRLTGERAILRDSAIDVIAWCDKTESGGALYCVDRLRHAIVVTGKRNKLWAILIPGPDDVWAMPSEEAAKQAAEKHNAAILRAGLADKVGMDHESLLAQVVEWPHDAESHAESLATNEPDVLGYQETGIPYAITEAITGAKHFEVTNHPANMPIKDEA